MLEGELIFQVEDALVTKGAGELSFAPRNVPTRWPTTATPPRATCSSARPRASSATGRAWPPRRPGSSRREWALQPIPEVTSSARRSRRSREAAARRRTGCRRRGQARRRGGSVRSATTASRDQLQSPAGCESVARHATHGGSWMQGGFMLRKRVGRLAAVAIASAAIGGGLASPASASPPQFLLEVDCEALGTPVTVFVAGDAGIQRVIGQFAQTCDRGTMRVSVTKQ